MPTADFRGRAGPVYLPAELAEVVEGVFGLDDRPQAQTQFRIADAAAVSASYTPPELAALYRFPQGATGAGECIAIIELGGGYRPSDLDAYFAALGLATPDVVAVGVDGGRNAPTGDANGPDARGDARHRGGRCDRSGRPDRGLLRTEHRSGLHRRGQHGRPRPRRTPPR